MRAVVQRVARASVTVGGEPVGVIGAGYMVLLGVETGDTSKDAVYMADKIAGLRVFEDENGKLNLSISDIGGEILAVSQFTLLGDVRGGRRPSFITAEKPDKADELYEEFVKLLRGKGIKVETGTFRTHMQVELVNDGPVTILIDSKKVF